MFQANGLAVGQEKPLYELFGVAKLLEDKSIELILYSREPKIKLPPQIILMDSTDEDYGAVLDKFNGQNVIAITKGNGLVGVLGIRE